MVAAGFTQEESKNWSLQKRSSPPPPPPAPPAPPAVVVVPMINLIYKSNSNNKRAHIASRNSNWSTATTAAAAATAAGGAPPGAGASTALTTAAFLENINSPPTSKKKKLTPPTPLLPLKQTKRTPHQVLCASAHEQAIRVQFEHAWREAYATLVKQVQLPANQKGVSRIPATVICDAGRPPVLPETVEDTLAEAITTFVVLTAAQMKDKPDCHRLLQKLTACLSNGVIPSPLIDPVSLFRRLQPWFADGVEVSNLNSQMEERHATYGTSHKNINKSFTTLKEFFLEMGFARLPRDEEIAGGHIVGELYFHLNNFDG
eukprot:jgi/Psemu1/59831/gm1.59831_g